LLKSERVQEIWEEEGKSGVVRYKTWVTIGGLLAYVMGQRVKGDLADRIEDVARDLRRYVMEMKNGVDTDRL
jgi:hypothetical protein